MHDLGFASWTRRNFSLVKWTLLKQLMIFEGLSIRKWYCTNLISDSSAFSKFSLNIWKFSVHILLKPSLENFEHYFAGMWNECFCSSLSILWHCLSLGLKWKLTFSSSLATAEFSKFAGILSAALSQHHLLGFKIDQLEFHQLH